jgi:RimJ/RimL family protein N-acetyltransferase
MVERKHLFNFLEITPALLLAQSKSIEEAMKLANLQAADEALLPPDFVAAFAPDMCQRPGWMGFWIIEASTVVGSGMYKFAPRDGMVEIGYGIAPSARGKGAATALASHLCEHAFRKGATVVRAHSLEGNLASQRVLDKSGFKLIGKVVDPEDGEVLRFEKAK